MCDDLTFSLYLRILKSNVLLVSMTTRIESLWIELAAQIKSVWKCLLWRSVRLSSCKEHQTFFVLHSPTALAAEEAKGPADDVSLVQSAADDSLHNGALLFCNPGASSVPDIDPQSPQQLPEVFAELEVCKCESLSKDIPETSKDETSMGHLGKSSAPFSVTSHTLQMRY